jgi:hypothetical protein
LYAKNNFLIDQFLFICGKLISFDIHIATAKILIKKRFITNALKLECGLK